jgi:hypothetical protein
MMMMMMMMMTTTMMMMMMIYSSAPSDNVISEWMQRNIVGTIIVGMAIIWVPPCYYIWRKVRGACLAVDVMACSSVADISFFQP